MYENIKHTHNSNFNCLKTFTLRPCRHDRSGYKMNKDKKQNMRYETGKTDDQETGTERIKAKVLTINTFVYKHHMLPTRAGMGKFNLRPVWRTAD